jgi:hypothetical protein
MKRNVSQVCLSLGLLVSACGTRPVPPASSAPASAPAQAAQPHADAPRLNASHTQHEPAHVALQDQARTSFPEVLTCVSDATAGGQAQPQVVRLTIAPSGEGRATLQLQAGPQFWSHGAAPAAASADPRRVDAAIRDTRTVRRFTADGAAVALHRDGLVLRGTVEDQVLTAAAPLGVTCWSESELFGSSWGDVKPGTLPARFDWDSEQCAAADGTPALNPLPIEFVRETSFGECADLRGVRLNGGDLSGPVLQGWDLIGANLDGAQLYFASLTGASLSGADLSGLKFGYASVSGGVDDATRLPSSGCQKTSSPWGGASVECAQ